MKFHAKVVTVLIVLSMVFMLFAGCAKKEKGPVTVQFMSSDADLPAAFVEKFNKENPDKITIVRTEPDYTKFVAEAMAGNASDLINLGSGSDVAYYAPRGLFKDITPMLEKSTVLKMDDIDKLGNAEYQFDGKEFGKGPWYGLSKDYNNIGAITYNKEMFKAAGIPDLSETEPITYEDVYQLAKKLTKKDASGKVLIWGTEFSASWVKFLASDIAYMAGLSFFEDAEKSKMNNDPNMRKIWQYFARFFVEDLVPNVKNPAPGWTGSDFQSDRVAFVQLGYWFGAQMMSNPGYETKYGWAPTPVLQKGGPRVTNTLGATGIVMYAKTKNPEAAFKVFEWYMGGEYGQERAKTGWGIPPIKSLASLLPENNAFNKSRKVIALDDAKYFKPWQTSPWIPSGSWDDAWNKNIEPLVRGEVDYEKFVDNYIASMNKLLADGKAELGK